MNWPRIERRIRRWIRKGFTLVELLVVIGIIALLIAILMPALSRARKQALQVSCGSNERQVVYAALAYANDWEEQLPTRYSGESNSLIGWMHPSLSTVARLPIIGWDTVTIWDWWTYALQAYGWPPPYGHSLGGSAFMMRDYLKNDMDIYVCPDGWYGKSDWIVKWSGYDWGGGTGLGPWDTRGVDWASKLLSYRTGYLWLPHRFIYTAGGQPAKSCGPVPDQDSPGKVSKSASDIPELLILTDFTYFTGRLNDDCPGLDPGGCGIGANHIATSWRKMPLVNSDCTPPVYPPNIGREENPLQMPLGMNRARIDARTTWKPWQDWEYFKHEFGWSSVNDFWHSY